MTADNDLIWRGDALALLQSGLGLTLGELSRRVASIPAAEPPTLAQALAVPEIAALVEAAKNMRDYGTCLAERKYHVALDDALAAVRGKV